MVVIIYVVLEDGGMDLKALIAQQYVHLAFEAIQSTALAYLSPTLLPREAPPTSAAAPCSGTSSAAA